MQNTLARSITRGFGVLRSVAFATYKEWLAYRSHVAVSLFVGPVYFLVQYFIWTAVYSTRQDIAGLSLRQMIVYYGISAVIGYFTYNSSDWNLQMLVRSGKFMTFLLRPVSHMFFSLSQMVGHRLLALWMEFMPVYLIFLLVFKISLIPAYPVLALISILLSFLMSFLSNYCIGLMAFWLTETNGIRRAFQLFRDICAGAILPLTLFPTVLQRVLFFLPFQFITYVPVRVFIGSYNLAGITMSIPAIVGIQALAVLAMFLLTWFIWSRGIRRFTGVGA